VTKNLQAEVQPDIQQDVQQEPEQEDRQEFRQELRQEDRQELRQELKQEDRQELKQEVRQDAKPGIRAAVRHDGVTGSNADIRGVLIQLAGARLLLPNATIAEVLSYAPPEPVEAAPEWLLGKIRWRGWQLPLVAFAELAGVGKEPAGLGSKVVVLKALGGNAKAPYFAILSQGFPRLVTVSQEGLVPDSDSAELPVGVQSRVLMNEDTAFVPDLATVESLITDALAQAA
jgi:chemosensory pili system protein ChpC